MENECLEVCDLCVEIDNKKVLDNINIKFQLNEINVLIGPNGAGKSTLVNVLMGNPLYKITNGKILLDNCDITNLPVEERAKKGLFMSFQHPVEVEGVTMLNFLRTSYNAIKNKKIDVSSFLKLLDENMKILGIESKFRTRFLNCGFSGGEKKKAEILQLLLLEPKFAFLDEIDSGLDVDALKLVGDAINTLQHRQKTGLIIITHYNKILDYVKTDRVHILKNGKITESGDSSLLKKVELKGFK